MSGRTMNTADGHRTDVPRVAFGLLMVAFGGLLLLSNLELMPVHLHVGELWPLIFLVLGFVALAKRDIGGFLVFSALFLLFFVPRVHPDIRFVDILEQWPLFLVGLGVWTVIRSFLPERKKKKGDKSRRPGSLAVFRTIEWRPEDDAYAGDQVTAVVGAYKLELDRATPAPEGAVIDVFSMWGGVEIRVPRDWALEVRVMPLMGGVDVKSRADGPIPADAPRLLIRGFVVMGGLEVSH